MILMLKIQMMLMSNNWMMMINIIIMQLLMGKWMTCDKLSSGNGGCLIVNQAHTDTIEVMILIQNIDVITAQFL